MKIYKQKNGTQLTFEEASAIWTGKDKPTNRYKLFHAILPSGEQKDFPMQMEAAKWYAATENLKMCTAISHVRISHTTKKETPLGYKFFY